MPSTRFADTLVLDDSFARDVRELTIPFEPESVPDARLVALSTELASELGLDADHLRSPAGIDFLVGKAVPEGASPVAMGYAGHQFGSYSPRLGDGRAVLLGELVDDHGNRRDVHLKGSGRTPFSRGGDGKAALGPMLRELVVAEAMHALGIPTTRSLAVIATGERIVRDGHVPGAVLVRIASSHLRVGTFEYAVRLADPSVVRRLADHAIARHYPAVAELDDPYLGLFEAVVDSQASLVAEWMLVGFIHGVMNTDNVAISGETIDYGPCAFMDRYDPATVFSSIDHGGRYAYGNQPRIAHWNLARFAETLLPLIDGDHDAAIAAAVPVLESFPDRYLGYWTAGMRAKLGLSDSPAPAGGEAPADDGRPTEGDQQLFTDYLTMLAAGRVDYTASFRALAVSLRGDRSGLDALFADREALDAWLARWRAAIDERIAAGSDPDAISGEMDRVNPLYIPRNHLVEEALAAAEADDMGPFERLLAVVTSPYVEQPGAERYAQAAPEAFNDRYRTFCGT